MYSRILVPIDGSPTAERGMEEALAMSCSSKTHIVLLHVVDQAAAALDAGTPEAADVRRRQLVSAGQALLERARRQCVDAGASCEAILREVMSERAADAIAAEALERHCQLIVMGTHGRKGLTRLALGCDAELVVRHASVPVLVVRYPKERP
jgi:nucleotide-binding universal stress UspA family protein